jgi:hypothetical protein
MISLLNFLKLFSLDFAKHLILGPKTNSYFIIRVGNDVLIDEKISFLNLQNFIC